MRKYNINESHKELLELFNMRFGKKHDYLLVFNSYHKYKFGHNIQHFGKDPKYISSIDAIVNIKSFINRGMYTNDYPLPNTALTNYLFGDLNYNNIIDKFNEINNMLNKKRYESLEKYKPGL